MDQVHNWIRSFRSNRPGWVVGLAMLAAVSVLTSTTFATPPLGFVVNQILASGFSPRHISEHVQIHKSADGTRDHWQLQLQVQGDTDYYSQNLVLSAGGYSGWHSHPGLLVGAVKSGAIEFYDARCQRRHIAAGQVFTEDDAVHAIKNVGGEEAVLYISYLVQHGAPRRIDEAAPACSSQTGIP